MPNIVAIISDERVRKQIERFVGEMNDKETRIATFSKLKEFEDLYFKPPPKSKPKAKEEKPEAQPDGADSKKPDTPDAPVDLRLFSQIHVLIYDIESLGTEKVPAWAPAMMRKTKERGYWPEGTRTRMMLIKFEEDGVHKLDVLLPEIDDLIYLPLDRLIFLQKLEILMGLPKKIKGRFLFNQPMKQEIEISKITKMEKFSDVGLAVRNPVPLLPGMRAKFYVLLPGEKEGIRFFAKAIRSEPHPEVPNQFLVYFTFFGLRKKETTRIRQWLTRGPKFKMFHNEDRTKFALNPNDLEQVERAGPPKTIAVIDPDAVQATSVAGQIQNEMSNIQVISDTSLNYFVHKYLKGQKSMDELPKATKPEDIPGQRMELQVTFEQRHLTKCSYQPAEEEPFFGHLAKDIFKFGSSDWWRPFSSAENDLILDEALALMKEGKTVSKVIVITSTTGERYAMKIQARADKDATSFTFEINPVTSEEMAESLGVTKIQSLDAIVIDTAFLPADFNAWMEFMKTTAKEKGLLKRPEDLKIILMTDREDKMERAWIDCPNVVGLLLKPADIRQMIYELSEALQHKLTIYNFENVLLATTFTNIHISREIDLEWISEFGATLRSPTPFRPGSYFFLRKLIFDNAPNQCLAARVYFCEPHPEDKGQYEVSVLYFGITDAFLKFARTWIRETYAQSKAQA